MQYNNRYDKNGSHRMAIYCFSCSGQDHGNMHGGEKSKGFAPMISKQVNSKGVMAYNFKCTTCGYENHGNCKDYIQDYAIRK